MATTVLVAVAATLGWLRLRPIAEVDFTKPPRTVAVTLPYQVGETYTLGSTGVPPGVKRPVRITDVEVVAATGVEVIGIGAFDPSEGGESIGAIPGWPPNFPIRDPTAEAFEWVGPVDTLVGLRITAPKSGLRGVVVRWVDGDGVAGSRVFDLAVVTCAPGACTVDAADADWLLRELALLR